MYIVQVASECAPVIKAGGLGDVVYGLSRELESRGHCVEVILPKDDCGRILTKFSCSYKVNCDRVTDSS